MKTLPVIFASIALLGLASSLATAAEPGQWYATGMASYIVDDEDRLVSEDVNGLHLGIGKALNEYWNVEFNGVGATFSGRPDQTQWGLGLDANWVFNRAGRLSPYLLGGVGFLKTNPDPGKNSSNTMASYGVGVNIGFPDSYGPTIRVEARVRNDFADPEYLQDVLYSIGFTAPLGAGRAPADADGDGVPDDADRCPGTPAGAVVDARGCELDSDADGVVDSKDACPNTTRGARVDARGCEIKESDSDGDGVADSRDRCPNTPRGARVDARGCEFDSDKDGVVDSKDRCPNTAAGVRVDVNGCEIKDVINLPGVRFELNSAKLTGDSTAILDEAAATLRKHSDLVVEVAGHTDNQGADSYNEGLSQRRAESVRAYLISKGANAANLTARGYGESQPVADNSTKDGRARNRRVELGILER